MTRDFSNFPQLKQLKKRIHVNIVLFLNCDLTELEIRDSYEKVFCDHVSFCVVTMFLSVSYGNVLKYCSSCNTVVS